MRHIQLTQAEQSLNLAISQRFQQYKDAIEHHRNTPNSVAEFETLVGIEKDSYRKDVQQLRKESGLPQYA